MTHLTNPLEESKKLVSVIVVTLLFFGAVAFLGLGGAEKVGSIFNSLRFPQAFADSESSANLGKSSGSIQSNAPALAVTRPFNQGVLTTSIVNKRNSLQGKSPPARTGIILDPTKGELALLTRVGTRNAAQFSDGSIGLLSEADVFRINKQGFSQQDQDDIKALDARRDRFIKAGGNPNLKRSGAELVRDKRIQEALAKAKLTSQFGAGTFVNGKLFGNPNFGAPSNDPNNLTKAERAEIAANLIKNAKIRKARQALGTSIQKSLDSKGETQKSAALKKGANIIGGNKLNPIALAKLRERGLI